MYRASRVGPLGLSSLILAFATATVGFAPPARADAPDAPASRAELPARIVTLSAGSGQLVRLARPINGVFVADDKIADVQVKSPTQLYLFGKGPGQTSVYATDKGGNVVWSSDVRVGNNLAGVPAMLKLAMPDAQITATPMTGMVMLTGTVASPKDIEEADRLVAAFTGGTPVINRLKTAIPLQVNLQVKIAEVSRDLVKVIGNNIVNRDQSGGFKFGIAQGRSAGTISNSTLDPTRYPISDISSFYGLPQGSVSGPFDIATGRPVVPGTKFDLSSLGQGAGKTSLAFAGHLLGMDLIDALDLAETDGLVTTLAEPNLTALSGETASFLAGGEIPIPVAQGLGAVSVTYKQYGISLSFTPVVLSDGRISLKVRPEVSQLSTAGSVTISGFTVPAIATRRAETTVELGSGQSFMIGGLLNNNANNSTDKVPGLGALPVLGTLFRSNSFRRQQTELVIVVTPYLVKPVDANTIKLPTDGFKAPNDADRVLTGTAFRGESGAQRPVPTEAPATAPAPAQPAARP